MTRRPTAWDEEETIISQRGRKDRAGEDEFTTTAGSVSRAGRGESEPSTEVEHGAVRAGTEEDDVATIRERADDASGHTVVRVGRHSPAGDLPLAWLVVTSTPQQPASRQLVELARPRTVIGTDASAADVRLEDTAVSRRHAVVRWEAGGSGGQFVLYDLASTNGTLLNGEPVAAPRALRDGDRIRVGDTELAFKAL
jgi:hypothetical protein